MEANDNGAKPCPFCGETIRLTAIKCRFCNEMLAGFHAGDRVVAVPPRPGPSVPKARRGPSTLRNVVGVFALIVLGYILVQTIQASSARHAELLAPPLSSLLRPSPQVIFDEEVAVDADGWQARGFTLSSPHPVEVVAEGRTHADKGFTLYVMTSAELQNYKQRESFSHIPALEGLKVRTLARTATLPAGDWAVVVANTENILNTMVVRLRVVTDPASP